MPESTWSPTPIASQDCLLVGVLHPETGKALVMARFANPVPPRAWALAVQEEWLNPEDGAFERAIQRLAEYGVVAVGIVEVDTTFIELQAEVNE